MNAMVLAAGLGERLRPLTVYWAKPALPIVGRPLVHYTFHLLSRAGVREVVLNLHHRPETVRDAVAAAGSDSLLVRYSEEPTILGTGGGLKKAASLFGRETMLLVNGDTLMEVDLQAMVAFHRQKSAPATLFLRPRDEGTDYTPILVDRRGRIRGLGETKAAERPLMFAGAWVLEPEVVDLVPDEEFSRLELDVLPALIEKGWAFGFVHDGPWFDIGTPRRYLSACLEVVQRGTWRELWRATPVSERAGSGQEAVVVAGDGSAIHEDALFVDEVVLGSRVRVEEGATLQRSVVWDNVVVGEGALVRNSIVASGVTLAPKSRTVGKVVVRLGDNRTYFRDREIVAGHVVAPLWSPESGPPWM